MALVSGLKGLGILHTWSLSQGPERRKEHNRRGHRAGSMWVCGPGAGKRVTAPFHWVGTAEKPSGGVIRRERDPPCWKEEGFLASGSFGTTLVGGMQEGGRAGSRVLVG